MFDCFVLFHQKIFSFLNKLCKNEILSQNTMQESLNDFRGEKKWKWRIHNNCGIIFVFCAFCFLPILYHIIYWIAHKLNCKSNLPSHNQQNITFLENIIFSHNLSIFPGFSLFPSLQIPVIIGLISTSPISPQYPRFSVSSLSFLNHFFLFFFHHFIQSRQVHPHSGFLHHSPRSGSSCRDCYLHPLLILSQQMRWKRL